MKKTIILSTLIASFIISTAHAQLSATKDAQNLIIAKVIADYKMEDAEYAKDIETLRENQKFNEKLVKMLEKISNSRSKDSKNREIVKILQQAGKDIDKVLNVR